MAEDIDCRMTPIAAEGTFAFDCRPEVPCFNACCRDLNQVLTPYDVLRLARGLGLPTGEFLRRYTVCRTGPGSGLPIVSLVPGDPQSLHLPVSVRLRAAASTRTGPRPAAPTRWCAWCVARARPDSVRRSSCSCASRTAAGSSPAGRGHRPSGRQTRGCSPIHAENDRLLDLIGFKNRVHPRPLPPSRRPRRPPACTISTGCDDEPGGAVDRTRPRPRSHRRARTIIALLHLGLERVKRLLAPQAAGRGTREGTAMELNGKAALVLGGIKGIGKAVALSPWPRPAPRSR